MEITKHRLILIGIVTILLIIAFVAGGFILRQPLSVFDAYKSPTDILKPQKLCPAIARICDDGSTAKRGPDCTHICPEDSL